MNLKFNVIEMLFQHNTVYVWIGHASTVINRTPKRVVNISKMSKKYNGIETLLSVQILKYYVIPVNGNSYTCTVAPTTHTMFVDGKITELYE